MVDVSGQTVIAILTRAPSSGGKTRLFASLGCEPDPDLLTALLLDTCTAADVPGTVRVVCVAPPDALEEVRALVPAGVRLLPQASGDLGARMRAVFDDLLARGASAVLLIGSDLPRLPFGVLATACSLLAERPRSVVLGPARDGGYYLIGATRTPVPLFDIGGWGSPDVLKLTLDCARRAAMEVGLLAEGDDVDSRDDLRALSEAAGEEGRRTRAWFLRWMHHRHTALEPHDVAE